jgi:acetolactate synthase-1/2/3 large subunit
MRHGGQILVEQLAAEGADTAFCVPGESYLAALDGLYDSSIRTVVCRQEGGAAMMAEAYAKMTGGLGACFVSRGPGAANATIGVHIALQDSTPMILFVGQVPRGMQDREAFQEVDFKAMFTPLAKWAAEIRQTERIPEYVARAAHTARSGRPGPVVLALPEDMLAAESAAVIVRPSPVAQAHPSDAGLAAIEQALSEAERPVMVVGGPGWNCSVREQVTAFAERLDLPVVCAFRYQDYIDNRHPNYAGHMGVGVDPALAQRIREADLILAIGPRLGEITTSGYTLLKSPSPDQRVIHVHPGAEELGRVYRADIPVQANLAAFAARLADIDAPDLIRWRSHTRAARAELEAFSLPEQTPGAVKMERIVTHVSETVPDDAVVTNGAGNYSAWVHRYFRYRGYRSQLANTAGSMGYGVPSAIAAKLAVPERIVISFNGDGCFLMNGQELATAMLYDLPIVFIVVNNSMYGTIRMHQEREYPSRVSGTGLRNPDFAACARSFGADGHTVENTEDFPAAFDKALKARKPALIELKVDPRALTPRLKGASGIGS